MIRISVEDEESGERREYVSDTVLVLSNLTDDGMMICVAGEYEENEDLLCGMLESAKDALAKSDEVPPQILQ